MSRELTDTSARSPRIGVLALQGDVAEHLTVLRRLSAEAVAVRHPAELDDIDGLVIPGGESTTIGRLARLYGLLDPLRKRVAEGLPAFGTCAGGILLSRAARHADGGPAEQELVGGLDAVARRNAFGRQVDSFETDLAVTGVAGGPVRAVFIRAPWFEDPGPGVEVLAEVDTPLGARVVVARQGHVLVSAFHPELTGDDRLHEAFVDLVSRAGPIR